MREYSKRLGIAMAFLGTLLPGIAGAAPLVTVGVNLPIPAPVVLVRPAAPVLGWTWVDGSWTVDAWGHPAWVAGYWAQPARRSVVFTHPVHRSVVVRPAPVQRTVVSHAPQLRPVVVHRH